jgi:uncharacterized protein (TIGR03790 family)
MVILWPILGRGSPMRTLIVVNDSDGESLELGVYYAAARGIPQKNIVHVAVPMSSATLTFAQFEALIRLPVLEHLTSSGISDQIDRVVFAWKVPYRVRLNAEQPNDFNSLPAMLFYGWKDSPATPPSACVLTEEALNPLFATQKAFRHDDPAYAERYFPSFMLTGSTLLDALALVDRSVAADGTFPQGDVFLLRTSDTARNVQWPQFDGADFRARFDGHGDRWFIVDADSISAQSAVMGIMAGRTSLQPSLPSNTFLPGALGDHLTSFGGLYTASGGQMPITDWITAGAAGTFGTVAEPCNFTNKFPAAMTYAWYGAGYDLGDAYTMGVKHPYMGLVIGDPLCRPYADVPTVAVLSPAPATVVGASVTVAVHVAESEALHGVDRLDLYVDGVLDDTLWMGEPAPGNLVSATIGGTSYTVTVTMGDTREMIAQELAAAITNSAFTVTSGPDFIEWSQNELGLPGAHISCTATSVVGAAETLGIHAWAQSPSMLETRRPARQRFSLTGTPSTNDTVSMRITLPDSAPFIFNFQPLAGETRNQLMTRIRAVINADPGLTGGDGVLATYQVNANAPANFTEAYLIARSPGFASARIQLRFQVSGPGLDNVLFDQPLRSNEDVLGARGRIRLSSGVASLIVTSVVSTAAWPDGPVRLTFEARSGSAASPTARTEFSVMKKTHETSAALVWPEDGSWVVQGSVVTAVVDAVSLDSSLVSTQRWAEGKSSPGLIWDTSFHGVGAVDFQVGVGDDLGRHAVTETVAVSLLRDSDGDGLADAWELEYFGALTNATALGDADQDGQADRDEFIAGMDPSDGSSRFVLSAEKLSAGVQLAFPSHAMRRYRIEISTATGAYEWVALSGEFSGTGNEMQWVDDGSVVPLGLPAHRAYRVRARLP